MRAAAAGAARGGAGISPRSARAAQVPVPPLNARVTDLTGTLAADQRAALEAKLAAFETRKGSQIAVLIVPTTQPEAIEQFAIRVVEQWKLGRKGVDDGVLLIVAKNDRKLRIEVGLRARRRAARRDREAHRRGDDRAALQARAISTAASTPASTRMMSRRSKASRCRRPSRGRRRATGERLVRSCSSSASSSSWSSAVSCARSSAASSAPASSALGAGVAGLRPDRVGCGARRSASSRS